jgi:hydrogenase maturation protease
MADLARPRPLIVVIGCGNRNRSDDGVGSAVIAELRRRTAQADGVAGDAEMRLFDAGTDGMAVLYAARGCERLIVVDACMSGSAAGQLFEVPGVVVERPHARSYSLHDFRWDHALYAGRAMYGDQFPRDVRVLLIEASSVELGLALSPAVAEAVPRAADKIAEWGTAPLAPWAPPPNLSALEPPP